jgi:hypothetical protein
MTASFHLRTIKNQADLLPIDMNLESFTRPNSTWVSYLNVRPCR